ncbi:MAG: FAD-dependent thymidylate synthase, partial [Candidatus Anstonellales archaeon]
MERFSEEEMELLSRYCTNIDGNIFALINLPQTVCGALFSRYSRSPKSLRRVLLEEFIQKPESEFKEIVGDVNATDNQIIATKKAEEFYERVLVGYGDDSVAELGGAHIACENISNIATKFLQDSRIGISPLEKSTRYVYFDHKDENGQYGFYRDKKIMESRFADEYVQVCNNLFELYSSLIEPMSKYIMEKHPPPEGLSERAYASTVRAKVCDVLRGILPASTLTNVGLYGNGRAFEYLLTKAYSSPLGEIREIGAKMYEELRKVIPSFVKRATDKYGVAYQEYLKESANDTAKEVLSLLKRYEGKFGSEAEKDDVVLVDYDRDAEDKIITAIIFPHANSGLDRIMEKVKKLSPDEKRRIIEAYVG